MNLRKKAFTLVEMLVVIAIIAILAAALFPAIQNAINTAKCTAYQNKGRSCWIGIQSANAEREPLGLGTLFPADAATTNALTATFTSTKYFQWLMSCDASFMPASAENRLVSDCSPSQLSAYEWQTGADGSFKEGNNGFILMDVSDRSPAEDAFMVSRNTAFTSTTASSNSTYGTDYVLDGNSNVAKTRNVWVTKGGACLSGRVKYLQKFNLPIASTNVYTVIKAL